MQHNSQNALSPDELDKVMNSVVFLDLDELVRVTNKAIERGNHTCQNDGLDKGRSLSSKSALSQLSPADAEACLYACRFIAAVPRSEPKKKFPLPVRQQEQDSDNE